MPQVHRPVFRAAHPVPEPGLNERGPGHTAAESALPSPGPHVSAGEVRSGLKKLAGSGRGVLGAVCIGLYWLRRASQSIFSIFANLLLNEPVLKIKLYKVTVKEIILKTKVRNTQSSSLPNYFMYFTTAVFLG